MAQTSELKTIITAENKQFLQSIGQASLAAKEFGTGVAASFSKLKGFGTLLAAGAGSALISNGLNSIDKLAASADKLGISAESFQFLEFAAKRADMEVGDLELSMRKLNLSISRSNTTEFANAFKRLGLDADKLKSMKIDQAFYSVISALQKLSKSDQIDIGTKLFGKNFQNMSELTQSNINKLLETFKKAGGAVNIEGFEKIDEKIDVISTKWTRFKRNFTLNFVGPTLDYFDKLADKIDRMESPRTLAKAQNAGGSALDNTFNRAFASNSFKGPDLPSNILGPLGTLTDKLIKFVDPYGSGASDTAGNAASKVSKQLVDMGHSADIAASALKGVGQGDASTKLKKLLGIDQSSGEDYLKGVLPDLKQVSDPYFNSLLKDFQNNISSGTGNGTGAGGFSSLNNEAILSSLKQRVDEILPNEGESKSGMINAVNALTETYRKAQSTQPQKVVVEIKADKDGILKAVAYSQTVQTILNNTVKALTSSEAQATTASGG